MTETAPQRERSTIRFPYGDLDDAIAVARTVHDRYGLSCSLAQLAAGMGQSISGAFRAKVATASTFGVIETGRKEITLTDLGARIADPQTSAAARVEAFLSVPLYLAVFERFCGTRLPADTGLEAELVRLGVARKQVSKARQALHRSAEQAGFFSLGRDRLVQPAAGRIASVAHTEAEPTETPATGQPIRLTEPVQHPLLLGLWEMLPEPGPGNYTPEQQAEWIEAAKVNLKLLYGGARPVARVGSAHGETSAAPDEAN